MVAALTSTRLATKVKNLPPLSYCACAGGDEGGGVQRTLKTLLSRKLIAQGAGPSAIQQRPASRPRLDVQGDGAATPLSLCALHPSPPHTLAREPAGWARCAIARPGGAAHLALHPKDHGVPAGGPRGARRASQERRGCTRRAGMGRFCGSGAPLPPRPGCYRGVSVRGSPCNTPAPKTKQTPMHRTSSTPTPAKSTPRQTVSPGGRWPQRLRSNGRGSGGEPFGRGQ